MKEMRCRQFPAQYKSKVILQKSQVKLKNANKFYKNKNN